LLFKALPIDLILAISVSFSMTGYTQHLQVTEVIISTIEVANLVVNMKFATDYLITMLAFAIGFIQ
jgi:ABC-type uncharacterized transport system permease subunit